MVRSSRSANSRTSRSRSTDRSGPRVSKRSASSWSASASRALRIKTSAISPEAIWRSLANSSDLPRPKDDIISAAARKSIQVWMSPRVSARSSMRASPSAKSASRFSAIGFATAHVELSEQRAQRVPPSVERLGEMLTFGRSYGTVAPPADMLGTRANVAATSVAPSNGMQQPLGIVLDLRTRTEKVRELPCPLVPHREAPEPGLQL